MIHFNYYRICAIFSAEFFFFYIERGLMSFFEVKVIKREESIF